MTVILRKAFFICESLQRKSIKVLYEINEKINIKTSTNNPRPALKLNWEMFLISSKAKFMQIRDGQC